MSQGAYFEEGAFRCNSCNVLIDGDSQRTSHYQSEWHLFNVNRVTAGVRPISLEAFQATLAELAQMQADSNDSEEFECAACKKKFHSFNQFAQHEKSKKHKKRIAQLEIQLAKQALEVQEEGGEESVEEELVNRETGPQVPGGVVVSSHDAEGKGPTQQDGEGQLAEGETKEDEDEENDEYDEEHSVVLELGGCPFCQWQYRPPAWLLDLEAEVYGGEEDEGSAGKEEEEEGQEGQEGKMAGSSGNANPSEENGGESSDRKDKDEGENEEEEEDGEVDDVVMDADFALFDLIESVLKHMQNHHNFWLPNASEVADLPGLLIWVNWWVRRKHRCLNCKRNRKSHAACIQHMKDSKHLRLQLFNTTKDRVHVLDTLTTSSDELPPLPTFFEQSVRDDDDFDLWDEFSENPLSYYNRTFVARTQGWKPPKEDTTTATSSSTAVVKASEVSAAEFRRATIRDHLLRARAAAGNTSVDSGQLKYTSSARVPHWKHKKRAGQTERNARVSSSAREGKQQSSQVGPASTSKQLVMYRRGKNGQLVRWNGKHSNITGGRNAQQKHRKYVQQIARKVVKMSIKTSKLTRQYFRPQMMV